MAYVENSKTYEELSAPIAQVHGAGQAGNRLIVRDLTERIEIGDFLFVGMWGFIPTVSCDPGELVELPIYPPMIPTGMYRNMESAFSNGELVTRWPQLPKSEQS